MTGELEPSAWYVLESAFQDLWEKRGVKALVRLTSGS
jgi:hypothetical protein